MRKCTELIKNGERSLVEVRDMESNEIREYVVCTNFNNAKAYGSKWDWGHYFDVYHDDDAEKVMKNAVMYLYNVKEEPIPYSRMSEIATLLKDGLLEDDEESALEYLRETVELTEEEAKYFGVKDELYSKRYKIYEVSMERVQTSTIKIAVPEDVEVSDCNIDEYIENPENIVEDESEDWEIRDWDEVDNDLSEDFIKENYDECDIWNYYDFNE